MKLHLPIKLRASLIAAIIAVPALVYNARAVDYVAPDWNSYGSNQISLTELKLETSGNTYTALSAAYIDYRLESDGVHRSAFLDDGGNIIPLQFNGAEYGYYADPADLDSWVEAEPTGYYASNDILLTPDGSKYDPAETKDIPMVNQSARIIIETQEPTGVPGQFISAIIGNTTLETDGVLEIRNELQSSADYQGNTNIVANAIAVSERATVVLEDVNIRDYDDATDLQTSLGNGSRLVILNGSVDELTEDQKMQLNLADIQNAAPVGEGKQVDLGAVRGQGNLTILGSKDEDGNANMKVDIDSIASGTAGKNFGSVRLGNADVDIAGGISDATTVALVHSKVTAGAGVSTVGLDVDATSSLTAQGSISNNAGTGHADISGSVVSKAGAIQLGNGAIHAGAVVSANKDVTLNHMTVDAPAELKAETGKMTLTNGTTVTGAETITVGKDLVVTNSSSVSNSKATVGGSVIVTDKTGTAGSVGASSLEGAEITIAEGGVSNVQVSGGSSVTDSSIAGTNGTVEIIGSTVTNSRITGEAGQVQITNNSTVTDTAIIGGAGDVTITDSRVTATQGAENFISTEADKKGTLAATLAALGSQEDALSPQAKKDALDAAGLEVGSLIGKTTGDVSISNASVSRTVITGGGNVSVGSTSTEGNKALLEQIQGAVADGSLDAISALEQNFTNVVDGSIIDVRGNLGLEPQPSNNLTVGDAAVSNSVILGITGQITVANAVLDNNYVDGGSSLRLTNAVVLDTPIVNLQADISLTNSTVGATGNGPFVMNTLGTSPEADQDQFNGGSIILNGSTVSNGIIKSGYKATYDPTAEGGYTWEKQVSDQPSQWVGDPTGNIDLGVNLPFGRIQIENGSVVENMDISTVAGTIGVVGSTVKDSTLASGEDGDEDSIGGIMVSQAEVTGSTLKTQAGSINITGSQVTGSAVSTQNGGIMVSDSHVTGTSGLTTQDGAITVADSVVTDSTLSSQSPLAGSVTNGKITETSSIITNSRLTTATGDISLKGTSTVVQPTGTSPYWGSIPGNGNASGISSFQLSLSGAGVPGGVSRLSSISVVPRRGTAGGQGDAEQPVRMVVKDLQGNVIGISDNAINLYEVQSHTIQQFNFVGLAVDSSQSYSISFITEDGAPAKVGLAVAATNTDQGVTEHVQANGDQSWTLAVQVGYTTIDDQADNRIIGSVVSTGNGSLTVENTYMDSLAGEDGTKNKVDATLGSLIKNSYVNGSDITIAEGDLEVTGSVVRGDVNVTAGGTILLDGGSDVAMDGDRTAAGARDASLVAVSLQLRGLANNTASLANGQIALSQETVFDGAAKNLLILDNMNSAEGEGAGQLGNVIQWVADASVETDASLSIRNGSIIEAGKINASGPNAGDAGYFGNVQVSGDSSLVAKDDVSIRNLGVNTLAGDEDADGSTVEFQKDAWLTNANIQGATVEVGAEAHIGNLTLEQEGTLNLTHKKGEADTQSAIANIAAGAAGSINVVDQVLTTPVLNEENLNLGLNGGTVVLAPVTADQGATVASVAAANPHVTLGSITDASSAGVAAVGQASTIRTSLGNVLGSTYAETPGTPATVTATTYYYSVAADGYTVPEGQTVTVVAADGSTRIIAADDTDRRVAFGSIIQKTDLLPVTSTNLEGEVVVTGYTRQEAANLADSELAYLNRVTVPVVDENGQIQVETLPNGDLVAVLGQNITQSELDYIEGWGEDLGSLETKEDGIASLTVKGDVSADKLTINAYELGETDVQGRVSAVAGTGVITVEGQITGQEGAYTADNAISAKGIAANSNTLLSRKGNVSVGADGIVGDENTLTAEQGNVTVAGVVEGSDNALTALVGQVHVDGALSGDSNTVNGAASVSVDGGVAGDENSIVSQGTATLGTDAEGQSLAGSNNTVQSTVEGDVTLNGSVNGNSNQLLAAEGNVTAGDVTGDSNQAIVSGTGQVELGTITGSGNTVQTADGLVSVGAVTGDRNILDAQGENGSLSAGALSGDYNQVSAATTATLDSLTGSNNNVLANGDVDITHGMLSASHYNGVKSVAGNVHLGATDGKSLVGNGNTVEATAEGKSIALEGSLEGDGNELTANATIDTGSIIGDRNELLAGSDITVSGDVEGNENSLVSKTGDVSISGDLNGENNTLAAEQGSIKVEGSITGTNTLVASKTVDLGKVTGEGKEIKVFASGLSQDDVAIRVGTFAAQDTDLLIQTTSDDVYGVTQGNGAIVIGTMSALEEAELDLEKVNNIISNNSYVQIGAMKDSNARTVITAAKDIIIGDKDSTTQHNTGSSLTLRGANLQVHGADLKLTDSVGAVQGSITGSSLELTTSVSGADKPVYASSALTVTLDSLEIGGNASLTATTVDVKNLTIDGAFATLNATNLSVENTLTLQNGADMWINRVTAQNLVVETSTFSVTSLKAISSLTLTGSTGTVSAGLTGLTGDVKAVAYTSEGTDPVKSTLNTSVIDTTGDVLADNSSILVSGDVTGNDITAQKGGRITGLDITAKAQGEDLGDLLADGGTIAATGAVSGDTLTIKNDGDVSGRNITILGAIQVGELDNESLAGGTLLANGLLKGASLAASDALITATSGIDLGTGALTAQRGTEIIGSVKAAGNVTLSGGSRISGTVAMSGQLKVNSGSVGAVSGATQATLDGATVSGNLSLKEGQTGVAGDAGIGDVTAANGSIIQGAVSNANDVTLTNSTVGGSIGMDGILTVNQGSVGAVTGAIRADLDNADIQGNLTLSATNAADSVDDEGKLIASVQVEGGRINGSIVNAKSVDLAQTVVTGSVGMNGSLAVSGSSVGSITGTVTTADIKGGSSISSGIAATGKVTVEDSTIGGNLSTSVETEIVAIDVSGSTITGTVKADHGSVTLSDVDVTKADETTGVSVTGTAVTIKDGSAIVGSVKATEGNIDITGADTVVKGDLVADASTAVVTVKDASITGSITIGETTDAEGEKHYAGTVKVTGGSTGAIATGSATLTNTTVAGVTTTSSLTTIGDVISNGNVSVGSSLTVNQGTLNAGTHTVTVTGSTTLNNGEVKAGNFTTSGLTLNQTSGEMQKLTSDGSVAINGGSLKVTEIDINKKGADAGNLTLSNGASLQSTGKAAVDGLTTVEANGTLSGTTLETNGLTVLTDAVVTMSGKLDEEGALPEASIDLGEKALIVTGGTVNGSLRNGSNVTVTASGHVHGSIQAAGALTVTDSDVDNVSGVNQATLKNSVAGDITLADELETTTGGDFGVGDVQATDSTVGAISNANDVTLTNSATGAITMDGNLTADNATTGAINEAGGTLGQVDVSNGSTIGSGIAATGTVKVADSTIGGNLSTSVEAEGVAIDVTGSTITGTVKADNGAVSITASDTGAVTAGGDATITDSTVGSITVNAKTETGEDGTVTVTQYDATVSGSTVTGVVDVSGKVTLTDTEVTAADEDGVSVTGTTVTIKDGSVIAGGVTATEGNIDITGATTEVRGDLVADSTEAVVTVKDASITGSITTGKTTDEEGVDHYAGTVKVTGGSTGAIATGSATLTNTTVAGVTTMGDLTTNGQVVSTDNVTVGGDLSVNMGALDAGDKIVKVDGKTTLNHGEVKAGKFTTNGLELVDVGGTLNSLESYGDMTLKGQETLEVMGNVTIHAVAADEANGIKAQNGDLTLEQSGLIAGAAATVDGKTVVKDNAVLSGTTLNTHGLDVQTGGQVTMSGDADNDKAAAIVLNGNDLTVDNGSVTAGTISGAKDVTVSHAGVVTGDLTDLSGSVAISSSGVVSGSITFTQPKEDLSALSEEERIDRSVVVKEDSRVTGSIDYASNVTVESKALVEGDITMDGKLVVSDEGHVHGVKGATSATLTKAFQDGILKMATIKGEDAEGKEVIHYGTVTATDSIIGDVTNAGRVTLTGGSANSIAMKEGTFSATDTTVAGAVSGAEDSQITGAVTVGSLSTDGLAVNKGGSLDSTGDITADGTLAINGTVASRTGDISLSGKPTTPAEGEEAVNSSINADVTAHTGKLTLDGTLDAQEATLSGGAGVELKGTLNAGEKVAFQGTLTGSGTLNKTGGDTLELAGGTNLTGAVKVKDASTLVALDGAKLGALSVTDGSTLDVAGEGVVGSVSASSLTMDGDSFLKADLGANNTADKVKVDGAADLKQATVQLATGVLDEGAVKDQTRITIVEAKSITSGVAEDVDTQGVLNTLNVYADSTGSTVDLVFSKNYKGVEGKTFNQSQAAAGLASLEHLAPAGELGGVMDALAHTRSEADARAALDSLGGAGLAGLQKVMADETKEHLQTLRSTIKSVAAGLQPRYGADGQMNECIQSNAFAGEVTGGHSEVSGNGNSGKYTRDSIGFMLAYAHALPGKDWKFGSALSYSYADADCGVTSIKSDAVYFDLALMHDRKRFHQMGTLGFAMFDFETERDARVNAAGHSYSGHADGSTKAVEFNVSYEMSYDLVVSDQHKLSSVVMAEATFAQIDSMQESGMGNAGLRSEWDDLASLTFGVGGRYTYTFGEERNPGYFMVEALFTADTGDTMPKVNNSFIGGGVTFAQEGPDAGDCGLRLNAGVLVPLGDQWGIFGNVTSEFRENGTFVGGGAGVKVSF